MSQGAVAVCDREQQRDADEREQQLARKPGNDGIGRHVPESDANDQGQRERQDTDIDRCRAAQNDCNDECAD